MPNPPCSVAQALVQMAQAGLTRLDAQMLVLLACGQNVHDRAWLLKNDTQRLAASDMVHLQASLARRLAGEPMAYITGTKEFYGLRLQVDARVLDPRADTETLVDWALELLQQRPQARVIDLGTGSGAIALALKAHAPEAQVYAVDASPDALTVARANATRLGLEVHWLEGSWLQGVRGGFDLIVSNPPYIAQTDPHLAALHTEPLQALAGGADGLYDLRAIITQAPACLHHGGWLLLEHGHDQAEPVQALLREAGFAAIQGRRDLTGHLRCSGACWAGGSTAQT